MQPLALTLSLPHNPSSILAPKPSAPSHPTIKGRLNSRQNSVSLNSLLSVESPSHPEQQPQSTSPQQSQQHNQHFEARRRRKHRAKSRIARPKDAMPGYRRRRFHASYSSKNRNKFKPQSTSAPGGAAHFDRGVTSATYYNRPGAVPDHDEQNRLQQIPPPLCLVHSQPAVLLTCKKAGPNRGRIFFKCSIKASAQCDFFRWADDACAPVSDADSHTPLSQPATHAAAIEEVSDDDPDALRDVLRRVFGHEHFRPAQQQAISCLLSSRSTVALIPTGGGKSLIYQMFAAVRPGLVVVVTPLISLMQDQLRNLPKDLPGVCFRSGQQADVLAETERRICSGQAKILFISPERLFSDRFRRLMGAKDGPRVSLIVVDEVHCISQWSHNFRTSYLRIPHALFGGNGTSPVFGTNDPPVLALTATATKQTLEDICQCLKIDVDDGVIQCNGNRENLKLSLSRVGTTIDAKAYELVRRLKMEPFSSVLGICDETNGSTSENRENCVAESDDQPPQKKRRKTSKIEDDLSIGWGSNLNFTKRVRANSKIQRRKHSGSLIVYVTKQKDCEVVRNYLQSSSLYLRGKIEMYHAGMYQREREKVQALFEKGSIAILVATVAFGMGLDYSSVKGVIHFDVPSSIEAYWQEVGRAGRRGDEAYCLVFLNSFNVHRILSRSHSDGIDKSTIRQFMRKLVATKFDLKTMTQRTREFLDARADASSDSSDDGIEKNRDRQSREEAVIDRDCSCCMMRLTQYDLNRNVDMRFETAETICAIIERELAGFRLLKECNTKIKARFYSQAPETLVKRPPKAVRAQDRMIIDSVLKHGKHSGGQYTLDLRDAAFREDQVVGSLRRLQEARHISFEMFEKGIEVECDSVCFETLKEKMDALVGLVYQKLANIEAVRVRKALAVARLFSQADELLSDMEQSAFLHSTIRAYFDGEEVSEEWRRDGEQLLCNWGKPTADRIKQIRNVTIEVMNEEKCGSRGPQSSRQITRILHGMDSAAFRAKDWYSQRHWGRFVDVAFEEAKKVVGQVLRERHERLGNRSKPRNEVK